MQPSTKASEWLRSEFLLWFGILGTIITVFSGLQAVVTLSDWASVIVEHWDEWTHAIWAWIFSWLQIQIPSGWSKILTALVFILSTIISQNTQRNKNRFRHSGISVVVGILILVPMLGAVLYDLFSRIVLGRIVLETYLIGFCFFLFGSASFLKESGKALLSALLWCGIWMCIFADLFSAKGIETRLHDLWPLWF